jgi:hypothetical protein
MPFTSDTAKKAGTKGKRGKAVPKRSTLFEREFIGSFKLGRYYVYYHIDNVTKEVFYIGKGCALRCYDKSERSRNELWWAYVNEIGFDYEVRIIAVNISEEEALTIEKTLLNSRKPKCNIMSIDRTTQIRMQYQI